MSDDMKDFKIIHSYSRKQAIKDGVLVDISETSEAKEAGFKVPVCVTHHLWAKIHATNSPWQVLRGHLWDVCTLAVLEFKNSRTEGKDCHLVPFKVQFYGDKEPVTLWLCFNEHEGFTIMFPEDY